MPAPRWPTWLVCAPTIVAESLAAVPEPLLTALRPGPPAPAAKVAAAIARLLAPPEERAEAPPWLWAAHGPTLRRVVAAIREHGGALLADPVGTGKTYVALAAASVLEPGAPVVCFAPAVLVPQWEAAARRVGVRVVTWSHQRVSRGALPSHGVRFAIVDESHHYRSPEARRHRHLAEWLVGRRALLLTATPVVNRLRDLACQLALSVRDDALAADGVPSLRALLEQGRGHPALGRLIFSRSADRSRPHARSRVVTLADESLGGVLAVLTAMERLVLSPQRAVARLVRGVLWRAAASSPAALLAALGRYRRLLLHARDAAHAGVGVGRAEVLRLTDGLGDQLLMWELLGGEEEDAGLALEDLAIIDELVAAAQAAAGAPDAKVLRLAALLADERPTLVFTAARATVRHLRDRLPGRAVAWCTGERAGVGPTPVVRDVVVGWFGRSDASRPGAPPLAHHLITTDVAAEGLDLRRVERVVHYDLPWTPMRLEQREGRALRASSAHREVELVQFEPPPVIEARLRQLQLLDRKRGLPHSAGLGAPGRRLWRWRADLADEFASEPLAEGVSAVRAPGMAPGALAGVRFTPGRDAGGRVAAGTGWVCWIDPDGTIDEDADCVAERLRAAAAAVAVEPRAEVVREAICRLAPAIRERLRALDARHWAQPAPTAEARRLVARLQAMIRRAVRDRAAHEFSLLERALRLASGGHTAGEARLVARLAEADDARLRAALPRLPEPKPISAPAAPSLVGLVLFVP
jgi:hypothetical protein